MRLAHLTLAAFSFVAATLAATPLAHALAQPNGATIPSPMGCDAGKPTGLASVFACVCDVPGVCNIGGTCSAPGVCPTGVNAKCETTLSHVFNDNTCIPSNLTGLDPSKDAALTPETFRPNCGLTFTLLTRGTAQFKDIFGWYNVTGSKPAPGDLYPMLTCADGPGKSVTLDVKSDPRYKGGDIGFFIVTPEGGTSKACGGGDCCATIPRLQAGTGHAYFSERKYNADNTGPNPFIHLLVFDSKVTARKFYFAWEDIYGGSNNDFSDIVTSVDGVECSGGGEACDTGKPGRCARGAKACKNGALACGDLFGPVPETCNGVDDDCDGTIDDDATCPNAGEICHQGRCVRSCTSGEFPCGPGLACASNGLCVPAACANVTCPAGQICRGGTCKGVCEGIVCPRGQSCVGGTCLDLCGGVTCAPGQVCAEGACVAGCAQCGGLLCGQGLSCDAPTGACFDPSCNPKCPAGQYCEAGACKDACVGAVCPDGQTCALGKCVDPAGEDDGDYSRGGGCACDAASARRDGELALVLLLGGVALAVARSRGRYRRL